MQPQASFWQGKRVLLTGHTGFKGSWLVLWLQRLGAWRLDCEYTGERGALNVFWHEHELLELLVQTLGIKSDSLTRLRVAYENMQNGRLIRNSDIVLWGCLS